MGSEGLVEGWRSDSAKLSSKQNEQAMVIRGNLARRAVA
jgi:hypothetical protein